MYIVLSTLMFYVITAHIIYLLLFLRPSESPQLGQSQVAFGHCLRCPKRRLPGVPGATCSACLGTTAPNPRLTGGRGKCGVWKTALPIADWGPKSF